MQPELYVVIKNQGLYQNFYKYWKISWLLQVKNESVQH